MNARLHLALADLAPFAATEDAALPRLPALERLLADADRIAVGLASWQHWVHAEIGWPLSGGEVPAGALLADDATPASSVDVTYLVAAPVHLVAGLDHVQLSAAGVLPLARTDSDLLVAAFNAEFARDGLELSCRHGALVLRLPGRLDVRTVDPVLYAGRDIEAALPSGRDGTAVRRLMTEVQMWLHQQGARAGGPRALAHCNCLWPWGAGPRPPRAAAVRSLQSASTDPYVVALGRHLEQDAAARTALPPLTLSLLSLAALGRSGATDVFATADTEWFEAPARSWRQQGMVVDLFLAGAVFRWRPRSLPRFWRRARPWWEQLA
jgi:hypothetical protein